MSISKLNDVKIRGSLEVREFLNKATTETEGVVKLSNDLNSTSEVEAPTMKTINNIYNTSKGFVKKNGDTLTGALNLISNNNLSNNKYGLNVKNSALFNINQLVFGNHALKNSGIGILFLKPSRIGGSKNLIDYDILKIYNSEPYFNNYKLLYQDDSDKNTSYYTKQRTEEKISEAISQLIDGSQSTLDTMKELAEAIDNDANFATNITEKINKKLSKSGGTISGGSLNIDNDTKITFGSDSLNIKKHTDGNIIYNSPNHHNFNKDVYVDGKIYSKGNEVLTTTSFDPNDYYSKNGDLKFEHLLDLRRGNNQDYNICIFGDDRDSNEMNWKFKYIGTSSGSLGNLFKIESTSDTNKGFNFNHNGEFFADGDIYTNKNRKVWDSESWKPNSYIGNSNLTKLGKYITLGGDYDSEFGIVDLEGTKQTKVLIHNSDENNDIFSVNGSSNTGSNFNKDLVLDRDGNLDIRNSINTTEYKFNNTNSKIVYNSDTNSIQFVVRR